MCGRFSQSKPASVYARLAGISRLVGDRIGRFNVAPSQQVAVVTRRWRDKDIDWCSWGFVPRWARDPATLKTRPINARIETVGEKPFFRDAWHRGQRGMVPVDGFYEWHMENGRKQPYLIRHCDGEPLWLGALWDVGSNGSMTCTLLVGPPNDLAATLHDRMPIIIPITEVDRWIDPTVPASAIQDLLLPYPSNDLEAYRVSSAVNKPENDGPALLRRCRH